MGSRESLDSTLACPLKPPKRGGLIPLLKQRKIIMTVGLVTLLSTAVLVPHISYPLQSGGIINTSQATGLYDVLLLEVDQDGNLLRYETIDSNLDSEMIECWGKMVELESGGFVIAGFHNIQDEDNSEKRVIWVIWTDENYIPIMNQTYGETHEIHSVTVMNNGNLVIAHYDKTAKMLIINQDGRIVKEHSWSHGTFKHCSGNGFVLAGEDLPEDIWIAYVSADFHVVWNNTFSGFMRPIIVVEDGAGGYGMTMGDQLIRLDHLGNIVFRGYHYNFNYGLMKCKNGDYQLGTVGHLATRVNNLGTVLWERATSFTKRGILEISSERFLALGNRGCYGAWFLIDPGIILECYDGSGISLWNNSILPDDYRFFVTDVISNSGGVFTVLGVMYPEVLSSILDCFSVPEDLDYDLQGSFLKFGTVR